MKKIHHTKKSRSYSAPCSASFFRMHKRVEMSGFVVVRWGWEWQRLERKRRKNNSSSDHRHHLMYYIVCCLHSYLSIYLSQLRHLRRETYQWTDLLKWMNDEGGEESMENKTDPSSILPVLILSEKREVPTRQYHTWCLLFLFFCQWTTADRSIVTLLLLSPLPSHRFKRLIRRERTRKRERETATWFLFSRDVFNETEIPSYKAAEDSQPKKGEEGRLQTGR